MNIPKYAQAYLSQLANEKGRTARAAIEIEFGTGDFPVGPINDKIDAVYGLLIHDEKTTLSVSQSPEAALGEYVLSQQSATGKNSTMVLLRTADDTGFKTTTFAVKVIGSGTLTITLWNAATNKHSKTYSATSADGVVAIACIVDEPINRPNAIHFEGADALISNISLQ